MTTIATVSTGVNPTKLQEEMSSMDAGVLKDIPAKSSMLINGAAMTPAQIDAQFKTYLAAFTGADTAKTAYQAALVARRNLQVGARDLYLQVKKAVIAYFGSQGTQLADFGLIPAKATVPKTSAQKAVIAAKAKLTREARGTTSKKQKQAINPGVATPAVGISPTGDLQAVPPSVSDGVVPGNIPSASEPAAGASTSTTATSASAPAPAGSGGPASNA